MYSFLACANVNDEPFASLLEKSSTITKMLISSFGNEVDTFYKIIPEIKGGWFYLTPKSITKKRLISEFSDNEFSILVYGEVFQSDYDNHAEYIKEVYKSKNIDSVRQLGGCFSAIIVDLIKAKVYIASDLVGQRSLRYHCRKNLSLFRMMMYLSLLLDFAKLISILRAQYQYYLSDGHWKVKVFLKNIRSIHQNEYISWNDGKVKPISKPLLNLRERFDSKDILSCCTQVDSMIELMQDHIRAICYDESIVDTDLTAGIDCRAIFGIILSIIGNHRIKVCTAGEDNSLDVKIAKRIAELYGCTFNNHTPEIPNIDNFLNYSRFLAFFMNGDTDSKRAVDSFPQIGRNHPPHFKGLGGEIYRGYYYPSRESHVLNKIAPDDAVKTLLHKFHRLNSLPLLSNDLRENVKKKLYKIIYGYYDISHNGSESL